MKKQFGMALVAISAAAVLTFTACGDDSSSADETNKVATVEDLSEECEDGEEVLVGDDEVLYTCTDGKWVTEAKSSASKPKSSSSKVTSSSEEECDDEDECDPDLENYDEDDENNEEEVKSSSSKKQSKGDSGSSSGSGSGSGSGEGGKTEPELTCATQYFHIKGTDVNKDALLLFYKGMLSVEEDAAASFVQENFTCSTAEGGSLCSSSDFIFTAKISKEDYATDKASAEKIGLKVKVSCNAPHEEQKLEDNCGEDFCSLFVYQDGSYKNGAVIFRKALTSESLTDAFKFISNSYKENYYTMAYCSDANNYKQDVKTAQTTYNFNVKLLCGDKVVHETGKINGIAENEYVIRTAGFKSSDATNACASYKVGMVKVVRSMLDLGLKEGKDLVEEFAQFVPDIADGSLGFYDFHGSINITDDNYMKWVDAILDENGDYKATDVEVIKVDATNGTSEIIYQTREFTEKCAEMYGEG